MSRWGTIAWGDGTLWGASTGDTLAWGVEIDWDGDGAFDGSNEADRMIAFQSFRGRKSLLDPLQNFSQLETGVAVITLDNSDGRYDLYNTSSPLYPNIGQGVDARIRVVNLSTNTVTAVFYGIVTDIQASNYGTDKPVVTVRIEDAWRVLRRTNSYVDFIRTGPSVDQAMGFVLDEINWPERWGRSLEPTAKIIPYFWGSANRSAGAELDNMAQSVMGHFYIDASGQAVYRTQEAYAAPVLSLTQADILKNVTMALPWQNQRTVTKIKVYPRQVITSGVVYSLNSPLRLAAGETVRIWMDFTYNNQRVPVNTINSYSKTANTAEDGSGTDVSSSITVLQGAPYMAESRPLDITNTSGDQAFVTSLSVNGWPYPETGEMTLVYPASVAGLGEGREFVLDLPWVQDVTQARAMLEVLGPFLAASHPYLIISMVARPDIQFVPDLFDEVSQTIDKLGVNGLFRVGGIEHRSLGDNCQTIITNLYLEFYNGSAYWTWPVADFGVDTIFSW